MVTGSLKFQDEVCSFWEKNKAKHAFWTSSIITDLPSPHAFSIISKWGSQTRSLYNSKVSKMLWISLKCNGSVWLCWDFQHRIVNQNQMETFRTEETVYILWIYHTKWKGLFPNSFVTTVIEGNSVRLSVFVALWIEFVQQHYFPTALLSKTLELHYFRWFLLYFAILALILHLQEHSHIPWIVIVSQYLEKWCHEVCRYHGGGSLTYVIHAFCCRSREIMPCSREAYVLLYAAVLITGCLHAAEVTGLNQATIGETEL